MARSRTAILLAGLLIGAMGAAGCASPAASVAPIAPSPTASPTPGQVDGGTITLTDDGCTWDGNPGTLTGAEATIELVNETDDFGVYIIHRLKPEFSWQDGVDAIGAIQVATAAGEDWPNWTMNITTIEAEGTAEAGDSRDVTVPAAAGTYGVVCSANTSPTGDILTVFLVGPLEVAG